MEMTTSGTNAYVPGFLLLLFYGGQSGHFCFLHHSHDEMYQTAAILLYFD